MTPENLLSSFMTFISNRDKEIAKYHYHIVENYISNNGKNTDHLNKLKDDYFSNVEPIVGITVELKDEFQLLTGIQVNF